MLLRAREDRGPWFSSLLTLSLQERSRRLERRDEKRVLPRSLERAMKGGSVLVQAQIIARFTSTTLLRKEELGDVVWCWWGK